MMLSKFAVPSLLFCSVLGGVAMFPHEGEFGVSPNGEPWDCQNIPNIITLPSPSETDFTDPYVIDKYNEIWHCHMLEVNEKAADLKKLIVRGDRSGFIYANDPSNLNIDPDLVLQLVTWAVFDANIRVFGWKGYEKWKFPEDGEIIYVELRLNDPYLVIVSAPAISVKEVVIGAPWPKNPLNQAFPSLPDKIIKEDSIQKELVDNTTSVIQESDSTPKHVTGIVQVIDTVGQQKPDEVSNIHVNTSVVDTAAINVALKGQIQDILNHTQQAIINKAASAIISTLSDDSPEQRVMKIQELLATAISQTQEIATALTALYSRPVTSRITSTAALAGVVAQEQNTAPLKTASDISSTEPEDLAEFISDAVNEFNSQNRVVTARAAALEVAKRRIAASKA